MTHRIDVEDQGERFSLKQRGAQDLGRYDVIKDLVRVEGVVAARQTTPGSVIALTNDPLYWGSPRIIDRALDTIDADFPLTEGRVVSGELRWRAHAGAGTTRGREQPLRVHGSYLLHWRHYSTLGTPAFGEFRCLIIPVARSPGPTPGSVGSADGVEPHHR